MGRRIGRVSRGEGVKIIIIKKCEDCPYFEYACTTDNCLFVCEHIDVNRQAIKDVKIIQKWCPLKDKGEVKK